MLDCMKCSPCHMFPFWKTIQKTKEFTWKMELLPLCREGSAWKQWLLPKGMNPPNLTAPKLVVTFRIFVSSSCDEIVWSFLIPWLNIFVPSICNQTAIQWQERVTALKNPQINIYLPKRTRATKHVKDWIFSRKTFRLYKTSKRECHYVTKIEWVEWYKHLTMSVQNYKQFNVMIKNQFWIVKRLCFFNSFWLCWQYWY